MILKEWNEYSPEEKVTLLNHHYYYYGKSMVTLDEIEKLRYLIQHNPDLLWRLAVISHITRINAQTAVVRSLRANAFEELCANISDESTFTDEEKEDYALYGGDLLRQTVETFNNPQPAIPMTVEQIVSGAIETLGSNHKDGNDHTK